MPKVATNGVRLSIHGTWTNGRDVVNIFEALVEESVGFTRADAAQAYAGIMSNAWVTDVIPVLPNNYVHDRVDWTDLNTATGSTGTFTRATPATGGDVASNAGPQAAIRGTKNLVGSARGSRSGRTFLPGVNEANVDEDGILLPSTVASREDALNAFLSSCTVLAPVGAVEAALLVVIQWPSIEVTRPPHKVTDPDGVGALVEIDSFTVDRFISSQRRRLGAS